MNNSAVKAAVLSVLMGAAGSAFADIPAPVDQAYPGTLKLKVDATDLSHRIFNISEVIPAQPGPLTLLYPSWIPGHHSPTGPIDKVAGFEFKANGKPLSWERDPGNVYAFHVDVPKGADSVEVSFKFLSPQDRSQGRVVMTPEMLNLQWNTVALYPAGYYTRQIKVDSCVTLPQDWHYATALEDSHHKGSSYCFKTIDFENLVDSPMFAGKYYKRVDLDPGADTPIHLNVFADKAKDLEISDEGLKAHQALVQQMYKLYGAHHYNHYDFLLALTDKLGGIGLEHHRSSENSGKQDYFTKWDKSWLGRDLLAHEFNHSWDGKYRRPAELWTPTYNQVKQDQGLWVYEGQTQFWGYIVAARSGLWSQENAMDMLALLGATYDKGRPGMKWRTILDTTNDPTIAQRSPLAFRNYQMSEDYYQGGQLIWYAVDAKLRNLSGDKKSLNDFAKAFFGVHPGAWDINTYTFDDVVATLDGIQKYDWASFINARLKGHVNLSDSLKDQGWKLEYNDTPSAAVKAMEDRAKRFDFTYSLGFSVNKDGKLQDVLWDSPAFNAGLSPSMTLIAVNGEAYKAEYLKDAITAAKTNKAPVELLVKEFDQYKTISINYHGGLMYPHLVRIESQPDYLSEILKAL
ncbi:M61 family metallopeptidase [Shewanella fodinae]|uniref:Glycyl aminopeptidase n=1 Tax=Shewanella fodinae TaxID=552357 RepID=A0A4R2F6X3_9GAMM|nr:M61 family metallopeptidase [Shewanella fodinae]TCN82569.1 glycyl aminopeptidase [Shewanella fodinae]